eukprot:scaffold126324_cov38-Tisochrysis_lutea.AAC.1
MPLRPPHWGRGRPSPSSQLDAQRELGHHLCHLGGAACARRAKGASPIASRWASVEAVGRGIRIGRPGYLCLWVP